MNDSDSTFRWSTLPPFAAIITFLAARVMANPQRAVLLDSAVWWLVLLMFVILTALYGLFIVRGFSSGLFPLQLVAQGMLLCPAALSSGARMLPWAGVVMASCGGVTLAFQYWRRSRGAAVSVQQEEHHQPVYVSPAVNMLPMPFAVTDQNGFIHTITNAMCEAAGSSRDELEGQSITLIMNPGDASVIMNGKEWEITQKQLDGHNYFFMLGERQETLPSVSGPDPFIDPLTQLHSSAYAMRRFDEEIYRSRRYGHPLTAALFRVIFSSAAERDTRSRTAFLAFCGKIRSKLRLSDTISMFGDKDILLVLPECPPSSVDHVIQKVINIIPELSEEHPIISDATPLYVDLSYDSGAEIPSARSVLDALNKDMVQKYTLTPQT